MHDVEVAQLAEEPSPGNVGPDLRSDLDPPGPVVAPVVHAARLEEVCAYVVDVVSLARLRAGPEGKVLDELVPLVVHQADAVAVGVLELLVGADGLAGLVDVVPALFVLEHVHCAVLPVPVDEAPAADWLSGEGALTGAGGNHLRYVSLAPGKGRIAIIYQERRDSGRR